MYIIMQIQRYINLGTKVHVGECGIRIQLVQKKRGWTGFRTMDRVSDSTLFYSILLYLTLFYSTLSYLILFCSILPYLILSYLILSYPSLCYPILIYSILIYLALSCLILFHLFYLIIRELVSVNSLETLVY